MIDRRLAQAEEWWVIALKAYVLIRSGRTEEALQVVGRAAEAVPDDQHYRSLRGLCLLRLGRLEEAEQDLRWIWDHRDAPEGATWDPQAVAWAGYELGEYDEAARMLQVAIETESLGAHDLWSGLGQVRLARGDAERDDIADGMRALRRGIAMVHDAGQLENMLGLDLEELDRILGTRPDPGPAQAALAQVRELAARAQQQLADSVLTPDDELRAVAETAPEGSTAWLAAQAGLARAASMAGHWQAALDAYLRLRPNHSFPEADTGLARAIVQLQHQADRLVSDGQVGAARERYEKLLTVAGEQLGPSADVTVDLTLRAGFAALTQSDDEAMHRYLGTAVSGASVGSRLDEFAAAEQLFVQTPAQYWHLADGLRRLQDEYEPQAEERAVLDTLIGRLDLSRLYRLAAADVARFPVATPLTLKIGTGLSLADADSKAWLRRKLKSLQSRITEDTGVSVPGVRVEPADGQGEYVILIDDTAVVSGSLPLGEHFVLPRPGELHPGAFPARRDRDPLTGEWGAWTGDDEAFRADLRAYPPLEFVLRRLEAVIRRGLPCFVGSDDVQAWLGQAQESTRADAWDSWSDLARLVLPDRSARVLLSRVLQVLAREGVPLTAPDAVLQAMRDAPAGAGVRELAAAVRRNLRTSLPGNSPSTRRVTIPEPLEQALAAGLRRENGSMVWQLSRPETARLLGLLRDFDPEAVAGNQTALVVRSSELRPFLRRLVSVESPYVCVLAEDELAGTESATEELVER
jgi:tetratricopeptide (TPR) repeat protein